MEGPKVRSAVTRPLQNIETKGEFSAKIGGARPAKKLEIVPDAKWPGMYRLRLSDGTLTDMVNLTRARDALLQMESRN